MGQPKRHAPQQRGFTLLEAMIVFGMVAAMIGVAAFWFQNQARNETRENWTLTQAKEMAMIAGAVQSFINDNTLASISGLADNTTMASTATPYPTVPYLISRGWLPPNFARRRQASNGVEADGVSPLGHAYSVYIRKEARPDTAVQQIRAVVVETGTYAPASLQRLGHQNTPQQIDALKRDIGTVIEREFKMVGVVVNASTRTARSTLSNFTKDLTHFLPAASSTPLAAVLVNFAELEVGTDTPPTSGPGPGASGASCIVLDPEESMQCHNAPTPFGTPKMFPSAVTSGAIAAGHLPTVRWTVAASTSISSAVPLTGLIDTNPPSSHGVILITGNMCTGLRTATCPQGKQLRQSVPAKCLNALNSAAVIAAGQGSQLSNIHQGMWSISSHMQRTAFYGNKVGTSDGMVSTSVIGTVDHFAGSGVTTVHNPRMHSWSGPTGGTIAPHFVKFGVYTDVVEFVNTVVGQGMSGYDVVVDARGITDVSSMYLVDGLVARPTLRIGERNIIGNPCFSGTNNHGAGGQDNSFTSHIWRYYSGATWSVCCDPDAG